MLCRHVEGAVQTPGGRWVLFAYRAHDLQGQAESHSSWSKINFVKTLPRYNLIFLYVMLLRVVIWMPKPFMTDSWEVLKYFNGIVG